MIKQSTTKHQLTHQSLSVLQKNPVTEFKLNINTPGSRVDREIDINFNLNSAQKTLNLNAKTPWKKATLSAELTNTDKMRRVSATALIDDRDEYSFIAQVEVSAKKFGTQYTPLIQVNMPGQPIRKLAGSMLYRNNKKFDIDLTATNVLSDPLSFKGIGMGSGLCGIRYFIWMGANMCNVN